MIQESNVRIHNYVLMNPVIYRVCLETPCDSKNLTPLNDWTWLYFGNITIDCIWNVEKDDYMALISWKPIID